MDKKTLKQYRAIKRQIAYLSGKIREEESRQISSVPGKVKGSLREFPYTAASFQVEMCDPKEEKIRQGRIGRWEEELANLEEQAEKIEGFIDRINDTEVREIFRYYYLEGYRQEEIAKILHIDRSLVSKKMKNYVIGT